MARRQIKKPRNGELATDGQATQNGQTQMFDHDLEKPATDQEKKLWQGWCEIESEPAFFNVMLKEFGVKGAKIQEIFSLDEEMIQFLPKPVFGIIFLYRFNEDPTESQEIGCPEHVWFANQTAGNACATVSMLNIVNNVPEIELGEHLASFKSFTEAFAPAFRGEQIAHFEFIKHIHNSFARKIDMMNIDLAMKESAGRKKGAKGGLEEEDDSAFHFVAYLPIRGEVWKLDGLERQPMCLGKLHGQDWLSFVTPFITERMITLGEQGETFGLLGMVQDPLVSHRAQLSESIRTVQYIENVIRSGHQSEQSAAQEDFIGDSSLHDLFDQGLLNGPSGAYGITQEMLDEAEPQGENKDLCSKIHTDPNKMGIVKNLVQFQREIRASVMEEIQNNQMDQERADKRRKDYGPVIRKWLKMLAEKDELQDLHDKYGT